MSSKDLDNQDSLKEAFKLFVSLTSDQNYASC